jgi:hypothetical protein
MDFRSQKASACAFMYMLYAFAAKIVLPPTWFGFCLSVRTHAAQISRINRTSEAVLDTCHLYVVSAEGPDMRYAHGWRFCTRSTAGNSLCNFILFNRSAQTGCRNIVQGFKEILGFFDAESTSNYAIHFNLALKSCPQSLVRKQSSHTD